MRTIDVGEQKNLITTLTQIAEAVKAGELDTAIAGAAKFGATKN
jgi:hypothetical protein